MLDAQAATGLPSAWVPHNETPGRGDDDDSGRDIMNRELLTLYGLKWNPFATDLPVEGLHAPPLPSTASAAGSRASSSRQGGFAMIAGDPGTGKSVALRLLANRLSNAPRGWESRC